MSKSNLKHIILVMKVCFHNMFDDSIISIPKDITEDEITVGCLLYGALWVVITLILVLTLSLIFNKLFII